MKISVTFILLGALYVALPAHADPTFVLQGYLTNQSGGPFEGEVEMTFAVADQAGNIVKDSGVTENVAVSAGFFSFSYSPTLSDGTFWKNTAGAQLSVTIANTPAMLYPFGYAAYAAYAERAGQATSVGPVAPCPGSGFLQGFSPSGAPICSTGNCVQGETLQWDANVNNWVCAAAAGPPAGTMCLGNQVLKWTGSAWACGSAVNAPTEDGYMRYLGVGSGATPNSEFPLFVAGAAYATSWSTPSDERLKEGFEPVQDALDKVERLNGYYYRYRRDFVSAPKGRKLGVIAQQVREVVPEAVNAAPNGFLSIDYGNFAPLLIEAVKQQQSEIKTLEATVNELKKRLDDTQCSKPHAEP